MPVPGAPTGLAVASLTSNSLTLNWTMADNTDTAVLVYGSPGATLSLSGVYSLLATLPAHTITFPVANLYPQTAYTFKIVAQNGSGNSADSAAVSVTTLAVTPTAVMSTLGLQFQDLILRVAEFMGVASYAGGAAAIPTDAHDLDMCKRLANQGYHRFLTEKEWLFLNVDMTITPDGINYVFDLPLDFQGELIEPWTYPITGPITQMTETTEACIRALRAGRNTTGYPTLYAVQPKDTVDATTISARWQVVFWPTPTDNSLVLTARYRRMPMQLVNLTDRSVAGPWHDQTVEAAVLAMAEIKKQGTQGPQEVFYQTMLTSSRRKDSVNVTKNLGYYGDRSDDGGRIGFRRPRDQYRVDTINGIGILGT